MIMLHGVKADGAAADLYFNDLGKHLWDGAEVYTTEITVNGDAHLSRVPASTPPKDREAADIQFMRSLGFVSVA